MRFLLDTNILSEPLRPRPEPTILRRLERHADEVATATLVVHELLFGCLRLSPSPRREALERYLMETLLPSVPVLPYDLEAAQWHAAERARLTTQGRTPAFVDGQIAAIAASRDLTLVTTNVADFRLFRGLRVLSWAGASPG